MHYSHDWHILPLVELKFRWNQVKKCKWMKKKDSLMDKSKLNSLHDDNNLFMF